MRGTRTTMGGVDRADLMVASLVYLLGRSALLSAGSVDFVTLLELDAWLWVLVGGVLYRNYASPAEH